MAETLAQAGGSFGAHGNRHRRLPGPGEGNHSVAEELAESRSRLQAHGLEARWVAYPYGEYTPEIMRVTQTLGFALGFSQDPGAIGHGKLKEKDIVLPIALKLGEIINKKLPDIKIVYTRDTDVFIPLWKRTKIANESNGKLFVSLHCNSNNSNRVAGFETYFLSADKDAKARDVVLTENESIRFESSDDQKRYEGINFVLATLAQNAFLKYSQYLASLVQKSLSTKLNLLGMKDRGVKQGPFWVMVGATMPNILIEMGFISNKYEAKLLKQKATQNKIADAICTGIVKYKNDFENAL